MKSEINRLASEVGSILKSKHLKLVTVESCTGGWIAESITHLAGSSMWFERGYVTYSNEAKQELVGVRYETLASFGAVSEETAREMARGGIEFSHADVAVSVTGIAGPDGGSADKPVGTVWIAWADRQGNEIAKPENFDGDREAIRCASVESALEGIIRFLTKHE